MLVRAVWTVYVCLGPRAWLAAWLPACLACLLVLPVSLPTESQEGAATAVEATQAVEETDAECSQLKNLQSWALL